MQALNKPQATYNERRDVIIGRYRQFMEVLDDLTKEPVKVFDPLPKKLIEELELIREISKFLQNKKDEDIKKAAQAASQADEDAKNVEEKEVKSTEDKEEAKQE